MFKPTWFLIALSFLSACTSGIDPDEKWDTAKQGVFSAALQANGDHALIGSIHHGGSYWQLQPLERLYNWNHEAEQQSNIIASAISDNGKYAATAELRRIVLWNTQDGEAFWMWQAPADIEDMDLDNDGRLALLGLRSYEAALFDIQNGGVQRRLSHEGIVQTVDMTPDRRFAITGGDDSLVRVWDLTSGNMLHEWRLLNQIKVVSISDDGRLAFASSHRDESHIWDLSNGKSLAKLDIGAGVFLAARFASDNGLLVTGASSGQVHLWQPEDGSLLQTWKLTVNNPWVTKNTQVEDVSFHSKGIRAIGANGSVYHMNYP
ncbi:hypothetical protein HF888_15955 [Bermanella marisrubri]|uniref:WD40 repeat protein n=1 Tax=Bermanella marisrubri TaxID=207949 RepID=Q1MYZ3_9GAMM|nr:WD-40 repeat protein [Bermanella marisrubri]EAT11235.1 WD40 repeat protein [Oceanobacter sp. RED65] [Bermanella marisrubri]QIZ85632.1 hypothetical protein HF888_15955 [Bermanella marisrubri]